MGEISDALRREREERAGQARGRSAARGLPAPEDLSGRAEQRPSSPQRESDLPHPSLAESHDAHQLSLSGDREGEWRARAVVVDGGSPATECFRQLALRVRAELERRSLRSVAITGPVRNEGKTTVACDLALALASVSQGREVALVDLDLRRACVATDFGLPVEVGVEGFLLGTRALSEVCISIEKPPLDVFPAASPHASAHELLVRSGFAALVRELERSYTTVIFDTPPVLLVPDTQLILDQVGAYLVVARSGQTRERALKSMLELLPRDRLLGSVLNEGPLPTRARNYRYYAGDSAGPAGEE